MKRKPKLQNMIEETIKLCPRGRNKAYPEKIYALVKKSGHFECQLHTRKTIDGVASMIRKKQGYISGKSFFVYELPFRKEYIVYDSDLTNKGD